MKILNWIITGTLIVAFLPVVIPFFILVGMFGSQELKKQPVRQPKKRRKGQSVWVLMRNNSSVPSNGNMFRDNYKGFRR